MLELTFLPFPCPTVCTQLLVSRPDEENITSYLQLIEKCLTHEVRPSLESLEGKGRPIPLRVHIPHVALRALPCWHPPHLPALVSYQRWFQWLQG